MRYMFLCCFLLAGCENSNKIRLFKQWHLGSKQNTLDIEKAKSLPQFANQKAIYLAIEKLVKSNKTQLIIAEGCEGQINLDFKTAYNGWTMDRLVKWAQQDNFANILAPIGMKLKARFPKLKVLCGDNLELIDKNLRAMSDLRGFSGFYTRLLETQIEGPKKFKLYSSQLQSLYPSENIKAPIAFTRTKSLNALNDFERFIIERNFYFHKLAKEHLALNPVIIIGGLHVKNLAQRFKKEKISTKVITPTGYTDNETLLIDTLRKNLKQGGMDQVSFFQMPEGFAINKFPLTNLLNEKQIATDTEMKHLKTILKDKLSFKFVLSDFDQDGIRDFTISQNGEQIIISAEDIDWDNDGIDNIVDNTAGNIKIANRQKTVVNNHYFSKTEVGKITKELSNRLTLVNKNGVNHELIVLEVLEELLKKLVKQKFQVKYLVATKPSFAYGESVFFSYIKHTKVMEYYPQKLNRYLNKQYQEKFKTVQYNQFVNSYIVPLLIHSISHELAHSLDFAVENMARQNAWQWQEDEYQGQYLKAHRVKEKIINFVKTKFKFRNKTYQNWMSRNKEYVREVNTYLKIKDQATQNKALKKSSFRMNNNSKMPEHQLSFLNKLELVSLYALKNPSEWFAENYAMCVYQKFFPKSIIGLRSIELEHLLGINPKGATAAFCKHFQL